MTVQEIIKQLDSLLEKNEKKSISEDISSLIDILNNNGFVDDYLNNELKQIQDTLTVDRMHYYINRLKKAITEIKTTKYNDLNMNQWKIYEDIITDSLWIIDKRDSSGVHNAGYWGNFIPQIPNQLIKRYTKKGEWVLDTFSGSGTTIIEALRQGRNCLGIELNPEVVKISNDLITTEKKVLENKGISEVINGNSETVNLKLHLKKHNQKSVQLIIMHPPYWDIIKFSDDKNDLSNAKTSELFLDAFGKVVDNVFKYLDKDRFLAVVIGDKYSKDELIPLGFQTMNEILKRKFKLKSIIVKNFEGTTGKRGQDKLWRYRALMGGFYIFKHEYILLFQKL